jgi:hypothetical protein
MAAPVVATITVANTPNQLRLLLNTAFVDYAAKVVELEAAILVIQNSLAIACQHYEGSGAPAVGLGKNGDTYKDITNKMRYEKSEGAWLQLA